MDVEHVPKLTRRNFIRMSAGLTMATGLCLPATADARPPQGLATIIDLTLCDGCPDREIPACVAACRDLYQHTVPDPVDPIPKPFPRGMIEDWSGKKQVFDRLTPYNFIFVEKVDLEYEGRRMTLHIPRRCMHCDNPACATICPFTANHKFKNGAVVINKNLCVGGAKCRTVCPWHIPQRQSGVGIYLYFLPTLAGNGAMFKCNLCYDRLQEHKIPGCMEACPQDAMIIGPRDAIYKEALERAQRINGFIYGNDENGGTATLYVSPVPFDILDRKLPTGPGHPHFKHVTRRMEETALLEKSVLAAPALGVAAGVIGALSLRSRRRNHTKGDE